MIESPHQSAVYRRRSAMQQKIAERGFTLNVAADNRPIASRAKMSSLSLLSHRHQETPLQQTFLANAIVEQQLRSKVKVYAASAVRLVDSQLARLAPRSIRLAVLCCGRPRESFKVYSTTKKMNFCTTRYTFCSTERGFLPHCSCVYCAQLATDLAKISLGPHSIEHL